MSFYILYRRTNQIKIPKQNYILVPTVGKSCIPGISDVTMMINYGKPVLLVEL